MGKITPLIKEKNKAAQYLHFVVATLFMVFISKFPVAESFLTVGDVVLEPGGRMALGILFFCVYLWISEPVPFHITGCIGILLMTFLKLQPFGGIVKLGFGDEIVVFFMGVLILSSVITRSGLGKRVSMFILSFTGNNTSNIILGFIVTGATLGMFVTNMAVAAMLIPIAKSMLEEEGLKPRQSNFGKALMISCAYGATISGVTTPAAAGPNIIAMNYMREIGVNVSFLEWMMYGVPAAILMIIPCWLILTRVFKPEISRLSKTTEELKAEYKKLGPMTRDERATSVVFGITVALWLSSTWLSELVGVELAGTIPALVCTCMLFMPGVTSFKWKEISNDISWDGIILIATGMSLGLVMHQLGAALWLSKVLLGGIIGMHPLIQIFMIVIIIEVIKIGLSSNTVTAAIIMPIMIALAQSNNLPFKGILIPTALSMSLAFVIVASSPTNLIPYSTGYFSIIDMIKSGIIMTLVAATVIALVIFGVGSLAGVY